jgi:hypothetical protein
MILVHLSPCCTELSIMIIASVKASVWESETIQKETFYRELGVYKSIVSWLPLDFFITRSQHCCFNKYRKKKSAITTATVIVPVRACLLSHHCFQMACECSKFTARNCFQRIPSMMTFSLLPSLNRNVNWSRREQVQVTTSVSV